MQTRRADAPVEAAGYTWNDILERRLEVFMVLTEEDYVLALAIQYADVELRRLIEQLRDHGREDNDYVLEHGRLYTLLQSIQTVMSTCLRSLLSPNFMKWT